MQTPSPAPALLSQEPRWQGRKLRKPSGGVRTHSEGPGTAGLILRQYRLLPIDPTASFAGALFPSESGPGWGVTLRCHISLMFFCLEQLFNFPGRSWPWRLWRGWAVIWIDRCFCVTGFRPCSWGGAVTKECCAWRVIRDTDVGGSDLDHVGLVTAHVVRMVSLLESDVLS